jgi:hypothetical protein
MARYRAVFVVSGPPNIAAGKVFDAQDDAEALRKVRTMVRDGIDAEWEVSDFDARDVQLLDLHEVVAREVEITGEQEDC